MYGSYSSAVLSSTVGDHLLLLLERSAACRRASDSSRLTSWILASPSRQILFASATKSPVERASSSPPQPARRASARVRESSGRVMTKRRYLLPMLVP